MDDAGANPFDQFGFDGPSPSAPSNAGVSVREVAIPAGAPAAGAAAAAAPEPQNPFEQFGFSGDKDSKSAPAAPAATPMSMATNFAAGTNEGVSNVLGAPVDLTNWALKKLGVPTAAHPFLGSDWIKAQEAKVGASPDQIPANNEAERVARGAGAGVAGAIIPAAGAEALPAAAARVIAPALGAPDVANAVIGGAAGAGGQGAADAAPDNLKPLAATVGGLVAGAIPVGGIAAVQAARAGVRAIPPLTAAGREAAAQAAVGGEIAKAAGGPGVAIRAIDENPDIVPGSQGTLAQRTGNEGIAQWEDALRTQNKGPFIARTAEQEAARTNQVAGLQPEGNAQDVAGHFRNVRDALDRATQAAVDHAEATSEAAAKDVAPGVESAEEAGAAVRSPAAVALAARKAADSALYDAAKIPDSATVPANGITARIAEIRDGITPENRPMEGEEKRLMDLAADYGDHVSFNRLKSLRSSILDEAAASRRVNPQAYRRLNMLRGAVEDAMDHAAENQAALDEIAVKRGTMAPEDTTAARMRDFVDERRSAGANAAVAESRGGAPSGSPPQANGDFRANEAVGAGQLGPRSAAGNQGVRRGNAAPRNLIQFLRDAGGVKDVGGDLKSSGLDRHRGLINNKTGMDLDAAREAAAEGGYLGAHIENAMGETDVNDLKDAISDHPKYSIYDEGRVAAANDRVRAKEEARMHGEARDSIKADVIGRGLDEENIDKAMLDRAALIHRAEDVPIEDAYEQAVMRSANEDAVHRAEILRQSANVASDRYPDVAAADESRGGNPGDRGSNVRSLRPGKASTNGEESARGGENQNAQERGEPVDSEKLDALKKANASYREQRETFGEGPIGDILEKEPRGPGFEISDAAVPKKIFHPGDTGGEDVKAYIKAVGPEKATPVLTDLASFMLHEKAFPAGVPDVKKISAWLDAHKTALAALPADVRAKFQTVADAQQAVTDALAQRRARLDDFDRSAAAKVAGLHDTGDIVRTIGGILEKSNSAKEMGELVAKAAGDEAALNGIKQSAVEHILQKYMTTREAGSTGAAALKEAPFQKFMRDRVGVLKAAGLSDEQIGKLTAIVVDQQRTARSVNLAKLRGQSNTAPDALAAARNGGSRSVLSELALEEAGALAGHAAGGLFGGGLGILGAKMYGALRNAGLSRLNEIRLRAALDPEFAKGLLEQVAKKPDTGAMALVGLRARQMAIAGAAAGARQE